MIRIAANKRVRGREWLISGAVLAALTAFLMHNWLTGGLPTSSRREVLTEMSIVWLFRQEMSEGLLLSEWNPYWFSGFPWLRYLAYPIYYVLAALSLWGGISLEHTLVIFYVVVLLGSGLAMLGFLRRATGNSRAALVGAVIYEAFPFHNHVGVETWIHAAFWVLFPLALWAIEMARTTGLRRVNYALLAGVILGLFPLVSSEYAIFAAPFVVLYLTWREIDDQLHKRRRLVEAIAGYGLVGLVAVGVSVFFLLPGMLETSYVGIHAKHAGDSTFTDVLLGNYAVTPRLVLYAIARRFGLAASPEGLPSIVSSFWSVSWYPGIIATILALLGTLRVKREPTVQFALVGAVLSGVIALGPTAAFNVFSQVPVFGRLSPFRALLLLIAFASILAAHGVCRVEEWLRHRSLRWGLVVACLLLVVVDFAPSAGAYQTTDAYFTSDELAAYGWLGEQNEPGRVWDSFDLPRDQYLRSYSLSVMPRLQHIGYYDNGAALHTWQQFAWTDLSTVLHLHQVRYVLVRQTDQRAVERSKELAQAGYFPSLSFNDVTVWENPSNSAYARLYSRAALDATDGFYESFEILPDLVARNVAMVSPAAPRAADDGLGKDAHYAYYIVGTDGASSAATLPELTAGQQVIPHDQVSQLEIAPGARGQIWSRRWGYEEIYLQVQTPEGALLTISESWYPHWRVDVDGQRRQLLRTNWALMGVWLEPGMHQVSFYYQRPWYVLLGYVISLATCLALVCWWTWYAGHAFRLPRPPQSDELYP